jgi:hypothetical protein
MKRLVEFPLEDGTSILVEVDEPGVSGGTGGSTLRSIRPTDVIERARLTYEEAIDKMRPAALSVITHMRQLPDPPDEVAVELGISLSAEAGAFLASAAAQANLVLTLTWKSIGTPRSQVRRVRHPAAKQVEGP